MRVLLDMDGVITDFIPKLLEMYNYLTNENVKVEDVRGLKTKEYVGDPYTLKKVMESPGFIRNLSPAVGAIEGVTKIHKLGHEIVFVSNATNCPTSGFEKRDWLNYYFKDIWDIAPLVLTYYKHYVRGDVLVDDNPKNFKNLHATTQALLWHQNYNASVTGFERIYGWDHLIDWIAQNDKIK